VNRGVLDGLERAPQLWRPPGIKAAGLSQRGSTLTTAVTPLVQGEGGYNLDLTNGHMHLSPAFLAEDQVIQDIICWANYSNLSASQIVDFVIYHYADDGLPGKLLHTVPIVWGASAGTKTRYGANIQVPRDGWYWVGLMNGYGNAGATGTPGCELTQAGIMRADTIAGSTFHGLDLYLASTWLPSIPPPDLTMKPLNSGNTATDNMLPMTFSTCPTVRFA
jgi:hypothetical protein